MLRQNQPLFVSFYSVGWRLASDIRWQFIEESLEFQEETTTSSEKSLLFFLPL